MALNSNDKKQKGSIERDRRNILRHIEQPTLLFLCRIVPSFVTSNMLTVFGLLGSLLVPTAFYLAHTHQNRNYLFIAILGFAIQWFGDSLDGRLAYYRNIPRKWFGFSLDMIMDWMALIMMSFGFYIYLEEPYKITVFFFATFYAWAMIVALLKYKITDQYIIDPGPVGPTEVRVILCLIILAEVYFAGTIKTFAMIVTGVIMVIDIIDTVKTIKLGDERDKREKEEKRKNEEIKNAVHN
ncbi:MAG: CDP-alcohol phosphatidyltransferase family protein [Chitinophagales bacterium]|nr:CDP-alcohol phosphatidyltransferase family protein [Chitinophagales bacterium]